MAWKKWYPRAKEVVSDFNLWIGFGILLSGLIATFLIWGGGGYFSFIRDNIQVLWLVALSAITLTLLVWAWRLHHQLLGGYSDNFRDLDGWDYEGKDWRRIEKGILRVKGSPGFTKVGSHWENYTFTFKAKIISRCLGVIIRASDPNNYYMFQIKPDKIRPHRMVAVPVVVNDKGSAESEDKSNQPPIIEYTYAWQLDHNNPEFEAVPITLKEDWFDVKIIVKGQSVHLYIQNELVYERPSFLQIPTGKVGFRNARREEAYVKNVRVTLQS